MDFLLQHISALYIKTHMKNTSIKTIVYACFVATFIIAASIYVINVYNEEKNRSIEKARIEAENIYTLNQTILERFMLKIRPKTLKLLGNAPGQVFDPDLMSAFYNLRSINSGYIAMGGDQYRIKLSTINSRHPLDEADAFEVQKIREFNADRTLKKFQGVRVIDGSPYYTVMHAFMVTDATCVPCHSTPEVAPPGLVDFYGADSGFGWPQGQIISAVSIQIPLASALKTANSNAKTSSLYFGAFLCVFLLITGYLLNTLVIAPLQRARDVAMHIAANPTERLGERIALPKNRELAEFAQAFNAMGAALFNERASLEERVAERTAALAKANIKLERLSNLDGLTGLPNRRKFDEFYQSAWQQACDSGQPLAVILLDVDWFKDFNDRYGHQAGDDCLRHIARILEQVPNNSQELVARYGGEEFVVVLPGFEGQNALAVAQQIGISVENAGIPHDKSQACAVATVSAGVAFCYPRAGQNPEDLLKKADAALYKAKANGRNNSVLSD